MSGFLSDAAHSIIDNIKQKRKSPLYGAFAFSWLAYNWKPVSIFILSKKDIYAKIQDVSAYASLHDQLIYPAIMAVIIVLLMPTLHALYSYFDAIVGFVHESSASFKEWYNSAVKSRGEKARAQANIQSELTSAEEMEKIAILKKRAAEAEQEEALIRADISSVTQLQDERVRVQKYEMELNDKLSSLEKSYDEMRRRLQIYESAGDYVLQRAGEMNYLVEKNNFSAEDSRTMSSMIAAIAERIKAAQSGPFWS